VKEGKIVDIKKIDEGKRSPIGLNPFAFVQLMTGYKSRSQLEEAVPDIRIAPTHRFLVDILFPKKRSYIHAAY
jgi:hypothetical protein